MKKYILIIFVFVICNLYAQNKKAEEEKNYKFEKETAIQDRAGNTHNASNIGLFFENRGKLYSRRLSQGPDLEFPINSGKHYGYRTNPYVGTKHNVIQGRFTTNEEWEAVGGYHNVQLAKIAFSDNPNTWPASGWPLKDDKGQPIIKSDQDSYCAYNDSTNSRGITGLTVYQTGYAYGVNFAKNLLFFKFELVNKGKKDLDSVYFSMYFDCDVGNVSGGDPEYADDFIGFYKDKNFVYFYDDGKSSEWPNGKTGFMGLTFLKTPKINGKEAGITDMHYCLYDDDPDVDSMQYGIMSSDPALYNSAFGNKYFHLLPGNKNIHYDDIETIPATGIDLVAYLSSGPYSLKVGDTLTFITSFVAGETKTEMDYFLDQAFKILNFDFELSKPPVAPNLTAFAGNNKVILYWDDKSEYSKDNFSGQNDFEGYRLYRSLDRGVNWTLLGDFDVAFDKIGADKGLQYSFTDTTVINGIEYWYSITAYDRGDSSIPSLESPKGNSADLPNVKAVIPISDANGRVKVTSDKVTHLGTGKGNYIFEVQPVDKDSLGNNEYFVGFTYTARQERGKPLIKAKIIINDSSKTYFGKWGIEFTGFKKFLIFDYATGEPTTTSDLTYANNKIFPIKSLVTGQPAFSVQLYGVSDNAPVDSFPLVKDLISLAYSVYSIRNGKDTVINPRPFALSKPQTTKDGVIFKMESPNPIQNVSRIGGTDYLDIAFTVYNSTLLKDETYLVSVDKKGFLANNNGYIKLLIKNSKSDTILVADSLLNNGQFDFAGVRGKVFFNQSSPPNIGNIYSINTIVPRLPNIQDAYQFKIQGSYIDKKIEKDNFSKIKVVPNPYVVSSVFEPEYGELRREPLRQIQFINLPSVCDIHIFTIDGDKVKTINHSSLNGTATWDLRADGGREISSGIYIYVVKSEGNEFINRFAVIK